MQDPVGGWVRWGEIQHGLLRWRQGLGRAPAVRQAHITLAVACGVGMGELRRILRGTQAPTDAQADVLASVTGVRADLWPR